MKIFSDDLVKSVIRYRDESLPTASLKIIIILFFLYVSSVCVHVCPTEAVELSFGVSLFRDDSLLYFYILSKLEIFYFFLCGYIYISDKGRLINISHWIILACMRL